MLFVDCRRTQAAFCLLSVVMFSAGTRRVPLQKVETCLNYVSIGEGRKEWNFFFFKLCAIALIRINKIFNYSSIQWLARPFVQMSLRARGARIGRCTQQFCDVLTDSDLVCHYPSRTLHWKGLRGDHCQHEEIRFKTFSGASKQGLTVKLAVISMTKFFLSRLVQGKQVLGREVFLFFCRVQSKSLCTFQSTFKFQDFSETITWAPDSNWWYNMS